MMKIIGAFLSILYKLSSYVMKSSRNATILILSIVSTTLSIEAKEIAAPYLSIKNEISRAIDLGNQYLKSKQHKAGYWNDEKHPAHTALAVTAALRAPSYKKNSTTDKALQWIAKQQKKDGGIYNEGLATYNTSTSIVALTASENSLFTPAILKARKYLIGQQTDWGTKGETDSPFDGGIGYGGTYQHSDMSNTHLAIEALKLSQSIALDSSEGPQPELNWKAAIQFISRVQNLKSSNDQPNISDDGSFVYFPGNSKAGLSEQADGTKGLRGYGSMSYAGLLSMIYADLDADDIRVKAVKKWLGEHFTVKENPGLATAEDPELGQQGLYYYYQAMAKALAAANIDQLELKNGDQVDWRNELSNALLSKQREDGSWINENARWWENDPVLVTAYAVLSLEQIYYSIP